MNKKATPREEWSEKSTFRPSWTRHWSVSSTNLTFPPTGGPLLVDVRRIDPERGASRDGLGGVASARTGRVESIVDRPGDFVARPGNQLWNVASCGGPASAPDKTGLASIEGRASRLFALRSARGGVAVGRCGSADVYRGFGSKGVRRRSRWGFGSMGRTKGGLGRAQMLRRAAQYVRSNACFVEFHARCIFVCHHQ